MDKKKRIEVLFICLGVVLIAFFVNFALTGKIIYNATLTNVSEANMTSTSGIAHLNVSDANLILYFAMDDNNTLSKVYDYTNNSNDGDLINFPTYISNGLVGGCYNFSGANDYINISDSTSLDITGNVTLSAWVDIDGFPSSQEVDQLISGSTHNCVILENGIARCWGRRNSEGLLGNGMNINTVAPFPIVGGYNFSLISLGFKFSCGLLQNGSAMCWGDNEYGQLGDGTTTDRFSPVFVSGGYTFLSLSADSYFHTCGVLTNGTVLCWGRNNQKQ